MEKKWKILSEKKEDILQALLSNRGLTTKKDIENFLHPENPLEFIAKDVGIDSQVLKKAIARIRKAIKDKESIVVYADYDADGITAGAVLWETLYGIGARVMPYIPHREEEGYGLSVKGIDAVRQRYDPTLIITVDHGITAGEKVAYAQSLGMDVIITDHHVKPKKLPKCIIVHTTEFSGAGVAWFVARELLRSTPLRSTPGVEAGELLALVAIGTIADMVPIIGVNRSIAKYGLEALNKTKRVGLEALMEDAGLEKGTLGTYSISHVLAPRINAMGRIEHALDSLRLLCTRRRDKAKILAQKLGFTNKERQEMTEEMTRNAFKCLAFQGKGQALRKKLIFIADESYNQGVIGLVAGKLVEEFYRPSIVVAKSGIYSKASARSIRGFNIIEAIRSCSDLLVDAGGHPMAAGFTVETKLLKKLQKRLEIIVDRKLNTELLTRVLPIDAEIPFAVLSEKLWQGIQELQPFGFGNPEPVFATRNVLVRDARLVGKDGKHLKLRLSSNNVTIQQYNNLPVDAIAFNFGHLYGQLRREDLVDIAYSVDMNHWNGNSSLQLKIKDIRL
ncbi:single-stranded-DNA-specific exonuclease RecJ [Patescibacteria group bacterium]|nr:single-stranded-DNA-specific exonuclease RecJ [Patescibacteria group bacterium]MBU2544032.1 single-stranded-DNA-specific exonuclease RecJ [Patescibacteria group bacterium]